MRYATKITWVSIFGLALLLALPIAYSTANGYMIWWFPSRGSVEVDGITSGYLHKNWRGTAAIITRTDLKPNQSCKMRLHQLQEPKKKFREAVESMPALAFVADPKGNRTLMNGGWLDYTGLSPEEASALRWVKTITLMISAASPSDGARPR